MFTFTGAIIPISTYFAIIFYKCCCKIFRIVK